MLDGFISEFGFGLAMKRDWRWAAPIRRVFNSFGRKGYFDELERKYKRGESGSSVRDPVLGSEPIAVDGFLVLLVVMVVLAIVADVVMVTATVLQKTRVEVRAADEG